MKNLILLLLVCTGLLLIPETSFGHCDTKDGPVVADAYQALRQNNVNYALKWVQPAFEKEINDAFELTMKVRGLSPDAEKLADNYFFETLVRIHRNGEGVPYTGIKPSGTPVDEKILAADKSIEAGNLSPLKGLVPEDKQLELKKLFDKVMSLKQFDVNNLPAAREYIEAYVQFFHFAEGGGEHHDTRLEEGTHATHLEESGHANHLPWIVAGVFFVTSIFFAMLYYRNK